MRGAIARVVLAAPPFRKRGRGDKTTDRTRPRHAGCGTTPVKPNRLASHAVSAAGLRCRGSFGFTRRRFMSWMTSRVGGVVASGGVPPKDKNTTGPAHLGAEPAAGNFLGLMACTLPDVRCRPRCGRGLAAVRPPCAVSWCDRQCADPSRRAARGTRPGRQPWPAGCRPRCRRRSLQRGHPRG